MSERAGVRLLQGYLWLPWELDYDPRAHLPEALIVQGQTVHLLLDPVDPPFAFFDDGTPAASQRFYQLTALAITDEDPRALHPLAAALAAELGPLLEATPENVGWLLLEDLRRV